MLKDVLSHPAWFLDCPLNLVSPLLDQYYNTFSHEQQPRS